LDDFSTPMAPVVTFSNPIASTITSLESVASTIASPEPLASTIASPEPVASTSVSAAFEEASADPPLHSINTPDLTALVTDTNSDANNLVVITPETTVTPEMISDPNITVSTYSPVTSSSLSPFTVGTNSSVSPVKVDTNSYLSPYPNHPYPAHYHDATREQVINTCMHIFMYLNEYM
jgi:hypothetical protein